MCKCFLRFVHIIKNYTLEQFDGTTGIIGICKSKKDRLYSGQKKKVQKEKQSYTNIYTLK